MVYCSTYMRESLFYVREVKKINLEDCVKFMLHLHSFMETLTALCKRKIPSLLGMLIRRSYMYKNVNMKKLFNDQFSCVL